MKILCGQFFWWRMCGRPAELTTKPNQWELVGGLAGSTSGRGRHRPPMRQNPVWDCRAKKKGRRPFFGWDRWRRHSWWRQLVSAAPVRGGEPLSEGQSLEEHGLKKLQVTDWQWSVQQKIIFLFRKRKVWPRLGDREAKVQPAELKYNWFLLQHCSGHQTIRSSVTNWWEVQQTMVWLAVIIG